MSDNPGKGRVTGLGGIFFKAGKSTELDQWYREHLGLSAEHDGFVIFPWQSAGEPAKPGCTVWAVFPRETAYFKGSKAPFMINYRVDDLDAVMEKLKAAGIEVDPEITSEFNGRFGWGMDPEGNRFELWEPAEGF